MRDVKIFQRNFSRVCINDHEISKKGKKMLRSHLKADDRLNLSVTKFLELQNFNINQKNVVVPAFCPIEKVEPHTDGAFVQVYLSKNGVTLYDVFNTFEYFKTSRGLRNILSFQQVSNLTNEFGMRKEGSYACAVNETEDHIVLKVKKEMLYLLQYGFGCSVMCHQRFAAITKAFSYHAPIIRALMDSNIAVYKHGLNCLVNRITGRDRHSVYQFTDKETALTREAPQIFLKLGKFTWTSKAWGQQHTDWEKMFFEDYGNLEKTNWFVLSFAAMVMVPTGRSRYTWYMEKEFLDWAFRHPSVGPKTQKFYRERQKHLNKEGTAYRLSMRYDMGLARELWYEHHTFLYRNMEKWSQQRVERYFRGSYIVLAKQPESKKRTCPTKRTKIVERTINALYEIQSQDNRTAVQNRMGAWREVKELDKRCYQGLTRLLAFMDMEYEYTRDDQEDGKKICDTVSPEEYIGRQNTVYGNLAVHDMVLQPKLLEPLVLFPRGVRNPTVPHRKCLPNIPRDVDGRIAMLKDSFPLLKFTKMGLNQMNKIFADSDINDYRSASSDGFDMAGYLY